MIGVRRSSVIWLCFPAAAAGLMVVIASCSCYFDCAFQCFGIAMVYLRCGNIHINVLPLDAWTKMPFRWSCSPQQYPFEIALPTIDLAMRSFKMPIWVPLLAAIFLMAVGHLRRRRSGYPGVRSRCHGCHYDLTGNVSGLCPECGRQILSDELLTRRPQVAHKVPTRAPEK